MAGELASRILLSKTDLSESQVEALPDAEAWRIIYSLETAERKKRPLQVCITGFGASKKSELAQLASEHGYKVVGSVTKALKYLVAGKNAGPKKLEAAKEGGVEILSEDELRSLCRGGSIER